MNGCGCIRVDEGGTVELDELMRFVATVIPAVPYEVGLEYLRQMYIDFARKTKLLVSHQVITLQRDVSEYILTPPEGYQIFGLLQRDQSAWGYLQLPSPHRWFSYYGHRLRMIDNDRIYLETAPSTDGHTLDVALHLLPTDCVTSIPQEIATPYGRGIAKGAVAELLEMPGKAWSNPRAASKYERDFHITCQSGLSLHLTNRGSRRVMMDPVRVL